jgi:hypothetical protein
VLRSRSSVVPVRPGTVAPAFVLAVPPLGEGVADEYSGAGFIIVAYLPVFDFGLWR